MKKRQLKLYIATQVSGNCQEGYLIGGEFASSLAGFFYNKVVIPSIMLNTLMMTISLNYSALKFLKRFCKYYFILLIFV